MNLILYIVDSLRRDHLSCYGYGRETTPVIDEIAENGCKFERAFSVSTWTKEAAVSLYTGVYPAATGVTTVYDRLGEDITTLPGILNQERYHTVGTTAAGYLSNTFGFTDGFDTFETITDVGPEVKDELSQEFGFPVADRYNFIQPSSVKFHDIILDELRQTDGDFFGLIWSLDVHDPYFVREADAEFSDSAVFLGSPRDSDRSELIDVYDDMIRVSDQRLGEFVKTLKRRGEYADTMLVVLSDHGEAFDEHGRRGHAGMQHCEEIDIPFIVKPADSMDISEIEPQQPIQLVDILPTVLDILGLDRPEHLQGISFLNDEKTDRRPIYAATHYKYNRHWSESIQFDGYKLIRERPTSIHRFISLLYRMVSDDEMRKTLMSMNHSITIQSTIKEYVAYLLRRDQPRTLLFDTEVDQYEDENLLDDPQKNTAPIVDMLLSELELLTSNNEQIAGEISDHEFATVEVDVKKQLEDLGYKL